MNEKKVRVKINSRMISLIEPEEKGDGDKIEYITDGLLRDTGKTVELSYCESSEMGFSGDTKTTLLYDKKYPLRVNLVRSGKSSAGLSFDPEEKRQSCAFSVEGMTLQFCILTREVGNSLTMDGGAIDLDYVLEFNGCKTERNVMRVEATPERTEAR